MKRFLKIRFDPKVSLTSLFIASFGLILSACENAVVSEGTYLLDDKDENPGDLDQDPNEAMYGMRALQMKTYEELKKTFQVLTGINTTFPLTDGNLETYYANNKASLPQTNNPESFGPSQVVGIQNYAAEFCVRTVDVATIRNSLYASTPFTQAGQVPRDTLLGSPTLREQLVDHLISKFWKPSSHPSRVEARSAFVNLVESLYSTSPANDNANGRGIVIGACTAGLSAIAVVAQ